MAKIIRDLLILTESGLTVCNRTIEPTIGSHIFGGLMIALNHKQKVLLKMCFQILN